MRNLARIGYGNVSVRWSQLGFGRTSSTSDTQKTPRNLFGFKDGTNNLTVEEQDLIDSFVWVAPEDDAAAPWLAGGSYLVSRRIKMHIEIWDRTSLGNLDAGLFFLAFTRDVERNFIPLQLNLARHDIMNEYIQHTGSAIFAVPEGVADGGYIGQALFEA